MLAAFSQWLFSHKQLIFCVPAQKSKLRPWFVPRLRILCVCTAAASTAGDDITATAHRLRVSCVSMLLVGGIQTVHGHGRTWTEVSGFQWHRTETCGSRVQDRGSGGWRWERDIQNSNRTNRFCTELLHIVLESGHAASPGTHRLDGMRRRWGDHARGHCNTFTVIYTSHSWYINSRHTQRVRCRVTRWYTGRVGHRLSGFPRCTASRVSLHLSSWLAFVAGAMLVTVSLNMAMNIVRSFIAWLWRHAYIQHRPISLREHANERYVDPDSMFRNELVLKTFDNYQ